MACKLGGHTTHLKKFHCRVVWKLQSRFLFDSHALYPSWGNGRRPVREIIIHLLQLMQVCQRWSMNALLELIATTVTASMPVSPNVPAYASKQGLAVSARMRRRNPNTGSQLVRTVAILQVSVEHRINPRIRHNRNGPNAPQIIPQNNNRIPQWRFHSFAILGYSTCSIVMSIRFISSISLLWSFLVMDTQRMTCLLRMSHIKKEETIKYWLRRGIRSDLIPEEFRMSKVYSSALGIRHLVTSQWKACDQYMNSEF